MRAHCSTADYAYRLVLLVPECALPFALSLSCSINLPRALVSRFGAKFVDSPLPDCRYRVPWLGTFTVPTRGQSISVAYILVIYVVLSSADYFFSWPNSWRTTKSQQNVGEYETFARIVRKAGDLADTCNRICHEPCRYSQRCERGRADSLCQPQQLPSLAHRLVS